jgi:hypothetical protein
MDGGAESVTPWDCTGLHSVLSMEKERFARAH